ncbi:MAG: 2-dehydropantoate 2-reductase N-terminal domain-containing protein [Pseudomonadota bacterium]|nr:2-dehydropantoate 2-reductase N-terminal domain-containing protein [Pseudomonadota bacterium]
MRIIIMGVGAVGGTLAVALAASGQEVVGVARGAQLTAIQKGGLTLRTPMGDTHATFPCVASPDQIDWRPDDAVVLTVKGQHTAAALDQLVAAGVTDQPIFCAQNGVDNERQALRRFANVHAVTVMLPATYLTPGEVLCHAAPKPGYFDIGRYPQGLDDADHALADALEKAGFGGYAVPDVMASKYGKLLMNLHNIAEAAIGEGARPIAEAMRAEARTVLEAAGIAARDMGSSDPRRTTVMKVTEIPGTPRPGSSTTQSLERGTGSIETDYLNGEICLLGRLHGVPTPANDWGMAIAARMLVENLKPHSISLEDAKAALVRVENSR